MNDYISLTFPFKESEIGYLFKYNEDTISAIKGDVLHILITRKGTRFFNRNFGTRLHEFLFEPNDNVTLSDIKLEVNNALEVIRPNITIREMTLEQDDYSVVIKMVINDNDDYSQINLNLIITN